MPWQKNVQYTIFKIIPLRLFPPLHRHHHHQHRRRRSLLLLLRRWCLMAPQIPRSESSHQNLPTKHTDISSLLTYLPTNRTNQPASQPNQTVSQPASHTHIYSVSQFFFVFRLQYTTNFSRYTEFKIVATLNEIIVGAGKLRD